VSQFDNLLPWRDAELKSSSNFSVGHCLRYEQSRTAFPMHALLYTSKPMAFPITIERKVPFDTIPTSAPTLFLVNRGENIENKQEMTFSHLVLGGFFVPSYLDSLALEVFEQSEFELRTQRIQVDEIFGNDLLRFYREIASGTSEGLWVAQNLETIIGTSLLRAVIGAGPKRSLLRMRHPGIRRAQEVMAKNYKEVLGIKELAQIACLSPAQFIAVFRKEIGLTPMEYLRKLRVEAAKRLLQSGEDVSNTSLAVGFGSVRGFRRVFTDVVGVSPSGYRAELRK